MDMCKEIKGKYQCVLYRKRSIVIHISNYENLDFREVLIFITFELFGEQLSKLKYSERI